MIYVIMAPKQTNVKTNKNLIYKYMYRFFSLVFSSVPSLITVTGFGVMMTSLTELRALHRLYEMVLFKTNYQFNKLGCNGI